MRAPVGKTLITMSAALFAFADHAYPQTSIGETLSGPDSHETGQGPHGHLLGDWAGVRPYLFERGASGSISNTSAIISRTLRATEMIGL
jgi:porin